MSKNTCGECRACCVVLPLTEPDFVKAAGEPCTHLCESGCRLFGSAEWPTLCREYYCIWRLDKWMGQRPLYRPDKLGVIFQFNDGVLALFEVQPGALQSPQVHYVKGRLRGHPWVRTVKNYPVGILDGIRFDPGKMMDNGTIEWDTDQYEWEDLGGGEWILKKTSSRIPLPLVA